MANEHGQADKQSTKKPLPPVAKEEEALEHQGPDVQPGAQVVWAGDGDPTIGGVADHIRQTWGQTARQRSMGTVQRQLGNKAATQVAADVQLHAEQDALIQRHPEGAELVPQAPKVPEDVGRAREGKPPPAIPSGETGAGGAEAAPTGAEPAAAPAPGGPAPEAPAPAGPAAEGGEAAPAPAEPAPAGPGAEGPAAEGPAPAGPAAAGPAAEGGEAAPAPAPVLTGTMTTAFAQQALTDAFGDVAGAIVPGNITVVPNIAALYAAYDQWCIDHNVTKADGSAWAAGDAAADDAAHGTRMNAFAEPTPGTNIWVDASGTDPTATTHEMLHINTAGDFRAAVGEIVNEGTTQRLAVRAVQRAGASVAGSENTYQREQEVVQAIVDLVGDDTVTRAYFGGAATLTDAYNALTDDDTAWATLKALLDANDFAAALTLLRDMPARVSIAQINDLLSGWVSDSDLAGIQAIYDGAAAPVKTAIRTAIEPRTHEVFWRTRTRRRVREIIEAT